MRGRPTSGRTSGRSSSRRWARLCVVRADGSIEREWITGRGRPDICTVDYLARRALEARTQGGHIRLERVCQDLQELLDLAGLGRGEMGRESERREEAAGLEESVDPGDSTV